MKKTGYITFSALTAALCVVVVLLAYFPYLTYALPAIAGLFIMAAVFEVGIKWALGAYLTSSIIVLLTAEPKSALLYVCFFGLYPILKVFFEKVPKTVFKIISKLLFFNASATVLYFLFLKVLGLPIQLFGKSVIILGLIIAANIVFLIYDTALVRLSAWYFSRIHSSISRIINK